MSDQRASGLRIPGSKLVRPSALPTAIAPKLSTSEVSHLSSTSSLTTKAQGQLLLQYFMLRNILCLF